jgi:hypothetical protein
MEPPEPQQRQATMVLLSPACRALRRRLGALTWVVFEDVVLDAEPAGSALHAATSARRVAENLGVTPGAAAGALRKLRQFGLLTHRRLAGASGRFGLSMYRVVLPNGMAIVPCVGAPDMEPPQMADRHASTATGKPVTRVRAARREPRGNADQLTLIAVDHDGAE